MKWKIINKEFYSFVWMLSEFTGMGLGKLAPYVFGKMIGRKGEKQDEGQIIKKR